MKPRNFPVRPLSVWAMLPLILLLASCATPDSRAADPTAYREASTCAALRPIYVSKSDMLTDETAKAILANDETWARLCKK